MTAPVGVILAGGLSRRMGGGDKGLLDLGDKPLLQHVIDRLGPQVRTMALNANGDANRFANYGLPVIADETTDFAGPLAGVLAGMVWGAAQGADHIVTVAADTPFFPTDLVARLKASLTPDSAIALAATPDPERGMARHPTFGLWPTNLADDLRQALADGTRKVVAWTDRHGTAMAEFPASPFDPFFNVNTPDDLIRAQELLR
ncbi:molybdenum cofactor guanylyltransferase MobA [Shimia ponticola]|uniref:molybdenum cofactor guanylyltransferase MobA n=1 Tax=Shimia ponticola TaxID=2582893 RepID=UPI0011BF1ADD|nr:molybdenum cofactor guanylyltransferase MobA [Shimia ponticola]